MTEVSPKHRPIRSFVRREGRLTQGQAQALTEHWASYGLDAPSTALNLDAVFGRHAPRVVEIGFGNGDMLLARAQTEPQHDFLGIEVHRPGVGRVLHHAAAQQLGNLRIASHDAVEVLRHWLPAGSLHEVGVYFPDPWHKKRHHKRRLIQPAFADLLAQVLQPGGTLRLATDWANYAEQMRTVLDAHPQFTNLAGAKGYIPRPAARMVTRFEQRGERLGHAVFDLAYSRNPG